MWRLAASVQRLDSTARWMEPDWIWSCYLTILMVAENLLVAMRALPLSARSFAQTRTGHSAKG